MNNIGWSYSKGLGVKQDNSKAFEYYLKSSELGNPVALYNLGSLYEQGKGVEKDYSKAIEYYQKSSELGVKSAREKLNLL